MILAMMFLFGWAAAWVFAVAGIVIEGEEMFSPEVRTRVVRWCMDIAAVGCVTGFLSGVVGLSLS